MLWILSILVMAYALNDGNAEQKKIHPDHSVSIGRYPHHVFIEGLAFTCNGAIFSPQYIVTSAACASDLRKPYPIVRANSSIWGQSGTEHRINDVLLHEDYKILENGDPVNDIALIRVRDLFQSSQCISLLEKSGGARTGDSVIVTGVGEFEEQRVLLEMQVSIFGERNDCTLGSHLGSQFCIEYSGQSRMGVINSDFGDLAVDGAKRLFGIHSWEKLGSNTTGSVAVYTSIPHHYDWILKKMGIKPH